MPVISLYWLSAQQKTSTLRRQKQNLLDSKFSVESNGFVPNFSTGHEVGIANFKKGIAKSFKRKQKLYEKFLKHRTRNTQFAYKS